MHGLITFLARPRWWLAPLAAVIAAAMIALVTAVGIGAWRWPTDGWSWSHAGRATLALGLAAVAGAGAWFLAFPLLVGEACERLARRVQAEAGAPPARELARRASLIATVRIVVATLPLRLAWLVVGLTASLIAGPVGIALAAFGMAHVTVIDAVDVALAARGIPGSERLAIMRRHRGDLRAAALSGAALNLALGLTIVGWLLWAPAMIAGAAAGVLRWSELHAGAGSGSAGL